MKIEQLIVQQLYNKKKVTLQDIGTFTLSPDVILPTDSDKDTVMPENAVSFEFNKKAKQDDDLIDFIVTHTRKIKPLATSDLESYSILAKQFLNIGKPFPIEGLGVLQKSQAGDYEFVQGQSVNAKLDAAPALLKEKAVEEISFAAPAKETPANKWVWALVTFLIIAIGATLYYFFHKENKDAPVPQISTAVTDTLVIPKDTLAILQPAKPDTIKPTPAVSDSNSYTFKVVIKEYPTKDAAQKAFDKYTTYGHKLIMYSKDSGTYKLAMPFKTPLADTLRAKDSLRIFFNVKTYVEKE